MKVIWIDTTSSTNTYIKDHSDSLKPGTLVATREQTAGRGQRGNSWEAEPGKNLTFSALAGCPGVSPAAQFFISEAAALAMVSLLGECGIPAIVKWPNDIYVGSRKIAGILIENSIMGPHISQSVIGIGLNVNQRLFLSDAPNPVSMLQLTGKTFSLADLALRAAEKLDSYLAKLSAPSSLEDLHGEYLAHLWRRDSRPHHFKDTATGTIFTAVVEGVEHSGHLLLRAAEGLRRYAFKEVAWL